MDIQQATLVDAKRVLDMTMRFYALFGYEFERERAHVPLQQLLANNSHGFVLLSIVDGIAVGYAAVCFVVSIEQGGYVAILDELYVAEEQRGAGIGGALIAAVEHKSRELGATAVALEVEWENPRAQALYQRSGYHLLERHVMKKLL